MRAKARVSYEDAKHLYDERRPNGAASRIYYALFQSISSELEARGRRPEEFGGSNPDHPDTWPHHVIRNNCGLAGITGRDAQVIKLSYSQYVFR